MYALNRASFVLKTISPSPMLLIMDVVLSYTTPVDIQMNFVFYI